jgi:hypothetical protein
MYIYTCMYVTVSNIIYFQSTTESHIHRQLSGISRHLDVDGLTIFSDPVQQRMAQIKSDYERQLQVLTAQLDEARIALIQKIDNIAYSNVHTCVNVHRAYRKKLCLILIFLSIKLFDQPG